MYGTQANEPIPMTEYTFENDVKMYGTQANEINSLAENGLRMM